MQRWCVQMYICMCTFIDTHTHICLLYVAVDSYWDDWAVWGSCTETCDGGVKSRTRTCIHHSVVACRGDDCMPNHYQIGDTETVTCQENCCPGTVFLNLHLKSACVTLFSQLDFAISDIQKSIYSTL